MDDTPTGRYGPHVEGAGVHHNPTRGPADGEWLYGHNWVALAWLTTHPLWGVIALPLRSALYGHNKISLAKRAAHPEGWQTITYSARGVDVTRQYKTFLATSELVSGVIGAVRFPRNAARKIPGRSAPQPKRPRIPNAL